MTRLFIKPTTPNILNDIVRHYARDIEHLRFHEGDSGFDLYVLDESIVVEPGETAQIRFGICCEVRDDSTNRPVSYWLLPRSSIVKTPLQMANSVGLIDAGYRGEIRAVVRNMSSTQPYTIKKGDRLFQLATRDLSPWKSVEVVNTLAETTRGEGGFGSTTSNP